MRALIHALTVSIGLAWLGATGVMAAPAGADLRGIGAVETIIEHAQYGDGRYCARLRRACMYKEERGEVGEGNCRRYREECSGRGSYCARLRHACMYKEERGEMGEGNCRRYRRECGGR